ncbi:hypothetical protein B0H19DRAFT_1080403 [Mycena capillaripes]|nr:hypothetical protein B0H19DRAFT_1080403 [Mycena capillaripes]
MSQDRLKPGKLQAVVHQFANSSMPVHSPTLVFLAWASYGLLTKDGQDRLSSVSSAQKRIQLRICTITMVAAASTLTPLNEVSVLAKYLKFLAGESLSVHTAEVSPQPTFPRYFLAQYTRMHKVDVKFLPQESRECPAEDIVGCSFVHCRCSKDLKVRQLLCQPKCGIFALVLLVFDNVEIHHTFEQVPQDSHSDVMKLAIVPANLNVIARVVHVKFRGACSDFTPTEAVVFRDQ